MLVTNVVPLRFERGLSEPKSLVLPLHHGTVLFVSGVQKKGEENEKTNFFERISTFALTKRAAIG